MSHTTRTLRHNRVELALHELAAGDAAPGSLPLLILHGLGEASSAPLAPWDRWAGAVFGLDFTGHGLSTVPRGGGYTAESLMSDVDVALAEIGPAAMVGRGLGAYVGLLVSGARPDLVQGCVLDDGPGLSGGGVGPGSGTWFSPPDHDGTTPDPFALYELSNDIRPPDYATSFVHLLMASSALASPLIVTARNRPAWLAAVAEEPGVVTADIDEAFTLLAAAS